MIKVSISKCPFTYRAESTPSKVLDRFAATKENVSAEDVTIHILMTKRKRCESTSRERNPESKTPPNES